MDFQRLRMSKRLVLEVHIDDKLKDQEIYPLLFLPLIENAFKYVGGEYKINLNMSLEDEKIIFCIENLQRRLVLLYPDKYSLEIQDKPFCFIARLTIETDNV